MEWVVLVLRLPTEPSRHRVGVWRELRRSGAVQLGQGTWALPLRPVFAECVDRVVALVGRGDGEVLVLHAKGAQTGGSRRLEGLYTEAREAEWAEFLSECDKYRAEIEGEIAKEKFTLAELDEEEQSLERLRRWHRQLSLRDVFGAPSSADAHGRLAESERDLDGFSGRVYQALHGE